MADNKIRLVVNGACGRMGRMVLSAAMQDPSFEIVAALEDTGCALVGADTGPLCGAGATGVTVTDHLEAKADVLIDFSAPAAAMARLDECLAAQMAMVIATTGLTDEDNRRIREAANRIAILQAANMSLGINFLTGLVAKAAQVLGDAYDVEIVEIHHHHKKDSPSGTALALGRSIAEARGVSLEEKAVHGRGGIGGERPRGEIGFHAVRGGDVVGEHTVIFAGEGERIEFVHRAHSRETFARGALRAARFLAEKPSGYYTMKDVLGLTSE